MDPRDRADAVLSRAQARHGVVTPDNMTSPMDAANTQQLPRSFVNRIDETDPDSTTVLPSSMIRENDSHLAEPAPTTRLEPPQGHQEPATGETEITGLVPTTRTRPAQSNVARRLEGL
ncbi:hypothetical protein FHU38_004345 [Saccharomonospora amisosensis]|uniref:Uncharacterized protein n=1 Tax=Saccharomonospora amisosensis TaxID=1128677 RepID=A0A7X5UTK2_9PSEU|nr:hypothetical protein [Saccharomonospora amisosensis]NIJ14001.1 hypothetical protein [Saccharomonospora amisosensis]